MEKMPPIQKIYEAYTALADDRFDLAPDRLRVRSSDGAKEYTVVRDGDTYRANDNATYWQGYAGYPVIVAMLLNGELPYDADVASWFAGVPWKRLNDAAHGDYNAALLEAFKLKGLTDTQILQAEEQANVDYETLRELPLRVGRLKVPVTFFDGDSSDDEGRTS